MPLLQIRIFKSPIEKKEKKVLSFEHVAESMNLHDNKMNSMYIIDEQLCSLCLYTFCVGSN